MGEIQKSKWVSEKYAQVPSLLSVLPCREGRILKVSQARLHQNSKTSSGTIFMPPTNLNPSTGISRDSNFSQVSPTFFERATGPCVLLPKTPDLNFQWAEKLKCRKLVFCLTDEGIHQSKTVSLSWQRAQISEAPWRQTSWETEHWSDNGKITDYKFLGLPATMSV
jgi:hypothetical protein